MIDRKSVIDALEYLISEDCTDNQFDYADEIEAAIALLKEQERKPAKPEVEHSGGGSTWWNVCGACKTAINPNDKYCHECGVSIDWRSDDDRTD